MCLLAQHLGIILAIFIPSNVLHSALIINTLMRWQCNLELANPTVQEGTSLMPFHPLVFNIVAPSNLTIMKIRQLELADV